MQIQSVSSAQSLNGSAVTPLVSTPTLPNARSSTTLESFSTPPLRSPTRVFFEDLCGFFSNLILWPFHGHRLIIHQIISSIVFLIVFPIILPFIILAEILRIFIEVLTCGCCKFIITAPKFELTTPSAAEYNALKKLVKWDLSDPISEESQIGLLHVMNTYLAFANRYDTDLQRGKKYDYFNCLIKVKIGENTQLFRYQPRARESELLQQYLAFIKRHGKEGLSVQHTLVGLDYSYMIGMFDLKIKTDIVDFSIQEAAQPAEEIVHRSCWSRIWKGLKALQTETIQLPTHQAKEDIEDNSFNLWPGSTRARCCDLINASLQGKHLNAYQISMMDLENMVQIPIGESSSLKP